MAEYGYYQEYEAPYKYYKATGEIKVRLESLTESLLEIIGADLLTWLDYPKMYDPGIEKLNGDLFVKIPEVRSKWKPPEGLTLVAWPVSVDVGPPELGLSKTWDESVGAYNYHTIEGHTILGVIMPPEQLRAIADEMDKEKK